MDKINLSLTKGYYIRLNVKANKDIKRDCTVCARVQINRHMNEASLYFSNGDYCDVKLDDFRTVGRFISAYKTMYAVYTFIEGMKNGTISISDGRAAL